MKSAAKWIWFANICGVASTEMIKISERFGSVSEIYLADYDKYISEGVSERLAEKLADKSLDEAYKTVKFCQETGVGILCYSDVKYPDSLRTLKDPPAVLYYLGNLPDLNSSLCIAMVGTRKMSEYGMRAAYKIAYEIASSGAVVISGMALGIDSVSASAALAAKGRTVAVLGCGIDVVYPKEHKTLRDKIIERGAVITEYPPSTEPRGFHFPVRNRIISGLSQGTAVIDADLKSGAMITAKTAILQGRDLYAVPSNIDSENASGTNSLIRDGAHAVLCGYDIVKNYAYLFRDTLNIQKMRNAEEKSEFNAAVLSSFGVRARGEKPAFEGISAKTEREQRTAHIEKAAEVKARSPEPKKVTEAQAPVAKVEKMSGDDSRAALESLSEKQRRIFEEMPLDKAIPIDYLINTGFKLGEVISALTVLEIKGLVSSLPGALYVRK